MNSKVHNIALHYGVGAIAGAVVVLVLWALSISQQFDINLFPMSITVEDFYMPVFWGGAWGLLHLLPFQWIGKTKGIIISIFPALTFMLFNFSWVHALLFKGENFSYLMRGDSLIIFAVYALFWGVFTNRILHKSY